MPTIADDWKPAAKARIRPLHRYPIVWGPKLHADQYGHIYLTNQVESIQTHLAVVPENIVEAKVDGVIVWTAQSTAGARLDTQTIIYQVDFNPDTGMGRYVQQGGTIGLLEPFEGTPWDGYYWDPRSLQMVAFKWAKPAPLAPNAPLPWACWPDEERQKKVREVTAALQSQQPSTSAPIPPIPEMPKYQPPLSSHQLTQPTPPPSPMTEQPRCPGQSVGGFNTSGPSACPPSSFLTPPKTPVYSQSLSSSTGPSNSSGQSHYSSLQPYDSSQSPMSSGGGASAKPRQVQLIPPGGVQRRPRTSRKRRRRRRGRKKRGRRNRKKRGGRGRKKRGQRFNRNQTKKGGRRRRRRGRRQRRRR